jgi:guanylate kinase
MSGSLYTISAPSGAGKTSLVKALIERDPSIVVTVSHTTRSIRPGEQNGVNYHFVSEADFLAQVDQGAFLEYAKVFGNFYGTAQAEVDTKLASGCDVILEIDWQGARQIRAALPQTKAIFILPPSRDALRERLMQRGQDDVSVIDQRMAEATSEMSHFGEADFIVLNDDFPRALDDLHSIFRSQRLHCARQQEVLQSVLDNLLKS